LIFPWIPDPLIISSRTSKTSGRLSILSRRCESSRIHLIISRMTWLSSGLKNEDKRLSFQGKTWSIYNYFLQKDISTNSEVKTNRRIEIVLWIFFVDDGSRLMVECNTNRYTFLEEILKTVLICCYYQKIQMQYQWQVCWIIEGLSCKIRIFLVLEKQRQNKSGACFQPVRNENKNCLLQYL
jgi:hypothetical protein